MITNRQSPLASIFTEPKYRDIKNHIFSYFYFNIKEKCMKELVRNISTIENYNNQKYDKYKLKYINDKHIEHDGISLVNCYRWKIIDLDDEFQIIKYLCYKKKLTSYQFVENGNTFAVRDFLKRCNMKKFIKKIHHHYKQELNIYNWYKKDNEFRDRENLRLCEEAKINSNNKIRILI
jgi:hypothetical protein